MNGNLTAAATHAIVVKGISIDNGNYARRVLATLFGVSPVDAADMAKVDRAIQVIHIIAGVPTGYTQVLIRPDVWSDGWTADLPPLCTAPTVNNYPASEDSWNPPWRTPREPLDATTVAEIRPAFAALTSAPKHVGLAATRCPRDDAYE